MFFDQVLAFDHVKKEIRLIVTADLTRDRKPADGLCAGGEAAGPGAAAGGGAAEGEKRHTQRKTEAEAAHVEGGVPGRGGAKEYIASGDVFQCVLSQRFDCVPGVDAFSMCIARCGL